MPKDRTKHAGRPDDEIARDIQQSLRLDDDVPDERITIEVNRGKVTLRGNVDNSFQKDAAESDAKKIKGVRAVANEIYV
jgi:osmotically-inducible protein OsmY